MLSLEPHEDSPSNMIYCMTMYFTYCQLWPLVVANAFYLEYVKKESAPGSRRAATRNHNRRRLEDAALAIRVPAFRGVLHITY